MTKTVSARIPNKTHDALRERCNKTGCTINEWINAGIDYIFTQTSEFDFGDDDKEEPSPVIADTERKTSEIKHGQILDDNGNVIGTF